MLSRHACLVLAAAGFVGAWTGASFAQGLELKVLRVQLKVSADPDLKDEVQKVMNSELRTLPGVVITDQSPDYTISVIALKVVNQSRRNVGTTFSVLISQSYAERIHKVAALNLSPDVQEELSTTLQGAVRLRAHWVETGAAGQLPQICKGIVQSFAKDALGEPRQPLVTGH